MHNLKYWKRILQLQGPRALYKARPGGVYTAEPTQLRYNQSGGRVRWVGVQAIKRTQKSALLGKFQCFSNKNAAEEIFPQWLDIYKKKFKILFTEW